jgi:hypothetical protein
MKEKPQLFLVQRRGEINERTACRSLDGGREGETATDALALIEGDAATPTMLTEPKLMLLDEVSLVESNMRAHMTDWPAAAAGKVAVIE